MADDAHAAETLAALGVPHECRIVSAHRTPDRLREYAMSARERGLRVIIAGAGGAAHLPGMAPRGRRCRCWACRSRSHALKGMDSLLSIVQMPAGIPVGTLAIGRAGAVNAALLAAAILATADPALADRLDALAGRTDRRGGRAAPTGRSPTTAMTAFPLPPTRPSASSAAVNWAACRRWRPRGSATAATS